MTRLTKSPGAGTVKRQASPLRSQPGDHAGRSEHGGLSAVPGSPVASHQVEGLKAEGLPVHRVIEGIIAGQPGTILHARTFGCATARERGKPCHGCQPHDVRKVLYRTSDVLGRPAAVALETIRLRCHDGRRRNEPTPGFVHEPYRMAVTLMRAILRDLLIDPANVIARRYGLAARKVRRLRRLLRSLQALDVPILPSGGVWLAVDGVEICGRVFTSIAALRPGGRRLLAVIPGRPSRVLRKFLRHDAPHLKILGVVMDCDTGLRRVVRRYLGVPVVADRPHLIRMAIKAVLAAKRSYGPRIPLSLKSEGGRRRDQLNDLLRRRWHRLTKRQQRFLERVFELFPVLGDAYVAAEIFRGLFSIRSPRAGRWALRQWSRGLSRPVRRHFRRLLKVVTVTWRGEVANAFRIRLTTSWLEALHREMKGGHRRRRGRADPIAIRNEALTRFNPDWRTHAYQAIDDRLASLR